MTASRTSHWHPTVAPAPSPSGGGLGRGCFQGRTLCVPARSKGTLSRREDAAPSPRGGGGVHRGWSVVVTLVLLFAFAAPLRAAEHTFNFDPAAVEGEVHSVHVAGSFNGWSRDASPLRLQEGGTYTATLDLPDGVHHYKFVVNGDRWLNDPASDAEFEQPDNYGGVNSAVFVGVDGRKLPEPRPNHILADAIRHDPARDTQVVARDQVLVKARTRTGDVEQANVVAGDTLVPMARIETAVGFDRYAALVPVPEGGLRYTVTFTDGDAAAALDDDGRPFTVDASDPPMVTPDWARDVVWYQIFPERFRNGEPGNDPGAFEYETLLPWTHDGWVADTARGEVAGDENFYRGHGNAWRRRFGGDLQGLREALPYLRRLGVTAIYLNPVFEGESMHKYDPADFRHIDDNFGVRGDLFTLADSGAETDDPATWQLTASDQLFLDVLADAKGQGFRVIIDGVFNHVGRAHFAFLDVLKHGRNSRYADWFDVTDWGDEANWGAANPWQVHGKPGGIQWRAWDGDNGHLPVFRKDAALGLVPGPRDHIFAITKRWLDPNGDGDPSDGIDGWRLDVPNDIPHPFWVDWRKLVKSVNRDAYISGEIWSPAHPWLQGDQFDAVMNYQFAIAGQDFFVDQSTAIPPSQFAQRLSTLVYGYPLASALVMQNLFDSHDTDRLASMFVNPDRPYDGANRPQDNGPDYSPRKPNEQERRRMMQAVTLQMTFVGAPMIYYGTEAGMWSPDDPSNRQPMVWQDLEPYDNPEVRFDGDVFAQYQRLIAIRAAQPALRRGLYRPLVADDDAGTFAFARDGAAAEETVLVALNRSGEAKMIEVPTGVGGSAWVDLLDTQTADVREPADDEAPDARPTLVVRQGAPALLAEDSGYLRVVLPAYGSAILVRR